jgi:hypothetical protein
LSAAGAEAIRGKNYRAFSPQFWVTKTKPARVIRGTDTCMGSLVNEPAFHEIEPLWAKATNSAAGGSAAVTPQDPPPNAALQKASTMETQNQAVAATADPAKDSKILDLTKEVETLKAKDASRRKADAEAGVNAAVKRGAIPAQNEQLKAKWQKAYVL